MADRAGIHPTALIDPGAKLGAGVRVGPFAVIGEHVELGDGCDIGPHAVLDGWTTLGRENRVGVGAVIGAEPQDRKYKGGRAWVRIGDRNLIREYVTIHRSADAEGITSVGSDNYLMAFVHVGHDCVIGNHVTVTNAVGLSGHCEIEDHAGIGGMTAFHQFVRVGEHAFIAGDCGVRMDVVPYALAGGEPLRVYGLNREGLKRSGISADESRVLKAAFRVLFWSGLNVTGAVARLKAEYGGHPRVAHLIRFVEGSRRGVTPGLNVTRGEHAPGAEGAA